MSEEKQTSTTEEQKPLDKMTVKDLREVAKDIPEITGATAMKKDELLAAIKEAKGIVDETPAAPAPKKAAPKKAASKKTAAPTTAKECKNVIAQLRKDKEAAKADGDKTQQAKLRRRINVLKKKSRKFKKAV